ncbi:AraC family transcriptional regulator [Clostridium lacusfryxellense]|uniref:AraC family transcriptional regulator n=1 Tax=Clostridium lacusfryxellense TaxID=205328 RepID=UPI001C0E51F7|nr:AraC family transcriptional regulator [Clostridium lacusfryxellense]MBU3113981.1 AraC family transcriptional regulator [Clostridium lacusfryxellense]
MKYLSANIDNPLILSLTGDFTADNKWMHMDRIIGDYEIIIINKGIVYIQQGDEKYELHKGDFLLIEPGSRHKGYDYSEKGTNFYWAHFYSNDSCIMRNHIDIKAEIAMTKNNPYLNELKSSILIPRYLKDLRLDKISVLFHQLLHLSQANYYTKQSVNYIITSLLIEIAEQTISNFKLSEIEVDKEDKLPKILQWIKIHIEKNISLKDVAYEFSFSKEYLARYFKKNMGMSMQQYINYLRISNAKQLLCQSDLNIKEIARKLGFIDEKYFLKLFKKHENLTPKQFKNAYNKTSLNIV